jgi:hypothetical protein
MTSKEDQNLEINTTEEVLEITNNPIELIYVVETQEAVTLPTQELPEIIADADVFAKIDGYRSSECCFRIETAARHLNLTVDQVKFYLKTKYPKNNY